MVAEAMCNAKFAIGLDMKHLCAITNSIPFTLSSLNFSSPSSNNSLLLSTSSKLYFFSATTRVFSLSNNHLQPQQANTTGFPHAYIANQLWYVDSGASHHVTASSPNLMQEVPIHGQEHVFQGNGHGLPIKSIGSAFFPAPSYSNVQLHLNNLLLVPSITKNLVSVSQIAKDNCVYFEFHPFHCFVKSQVITESFFKAT